MIPLSYFSDCPIGYFVEACRKTGLVMCAAGAIEWGMDVGTCEKFVIRTLVAYPSTEKFGDYPAFEWVAWIMEPSEEDRQRALPFLVRSGYGVEILAYSAFENHEQKTTDRTLG